MSKPKLLNLDMMSLQNIDEDSDLIPLMTSDDEEAISKESLPEKLPILPLKNTVMFPGVVIPITASRDKSIKLIKDANANDKLIGVVSQIDPKIQSPTLNDIHPTGTVAKILRVLKMPDGNVTVIIQGKKRFSIEQIISEEPYIIANVKEIVELKPEKNNKEFTATIESIKDVQCFNASDGTATASASGGTSPYSFKWDNTPIGGVTSEVINLPPGLINLEITDSSGCLANAQANIDGPTALTSSITETIHVLCNGDATGKAVVTVSGGTEGTGYSYLWNDDAAQRSDCLLYTSPSPRD